MAGRAAFLLLCRFPKENVYFLNINDHLKSPNIHFAYRMNEISTFLAPPWLPFGSLWLPFGSPWLPLAPFWLPLAPPFGLQNVWFS